MGTTGSSISLVGSAAQALGEEVLRARLSGALKPDPARRRQIAVNVGRTALAVVCPLCLLQHGYRLPFPGQEPGRKWNLVQWRDGVSCSAECKQP